jgi:hypothetical protein
MRPGRGGAVGVSVAMATAAWLGAPASASGDVEAVGWWTRSPAASAPDGGITVGAAPDGPTSVAALRVGDPDAEAIVIRLTESNSLLGELAAFQVCPTSDNWPETAGGALADAPPPNCRRAARPLERGNDGVWTVDVAPLLDATTRSVAIVPVNSKLPTAFEVGFGPPEVRSIARPTATTPASPAVAPSAAGAPRPSRTVLPALPPDGTAAMNVGDPLKADTMAVTPGSIDVPAGPTFGGGEGPRVRVAAAGAPSGGRSMASALALAGAAVGTGIVAGGSRWSLERRTARRRELMA